MSTFEVKHPEVRVRLIGTDGNIFALIGRVRRAMGKARLPSEEIDKFSQEVTDSGSYDQALQTIMRWVDVS